MWKYIARGFRSPFDKGAWTNVTTTAATDQKRKNALTTEGKVQVPCAFRFVPCFLDACQRHLSHLGLHVGDGHSYGHGDRDKESSSESQSDESFKTNLHLQHCPLIGAIGWSGVLVLGWTILQPWCRRSEARRKPLSDSDVNPDAVKRYSGMCKLLLHSVFTQPISNNVVPSRIPLPDDNSRQLQPPLSSPISSETSHLSSSCESGTKTIDEIFDEAAEEVRRVHEEAVAEAENRLGIACLSNMRDDEAVEHFRVASAFKHASAAFNLGQCYEMGIGTERNLVQAAAHYKIATDRGHPAAAYNLGVFYAHGQGGLKVDRRKARNLFAVAAALGQPDAKAALELEKQPEFETPVSLRPTADSFESRLAVDFLNLHNIRLHLTNVEPNLDGNCRSDNELSSPFTSELGSPTSLPSSPTTSLSSQWSSTDSSLIDNPHIIATDDSSEVISDTCSDEWQAAVNLVTLNGNSATLYKLAVCYENSKRVDPDILLKLYRMAADHGHGAAKRHLLTLEEQYALGTLDDYIKINKQGLKHSTFDCTYQK